MNRIVLWGSWLLISVLVVGGCSHNTASVTRDRAEASRNLGEAYMAEGNYTKALRELLKAEQMNPDDPYLHNDLGLTYLAKNDPAKAIAHFKKALDLNPDYSPALNNLGSAYIAVQEWDLAIEAFSRVKDDLLYATPYYPLTNLGYVYNQRGEYATAEKYYKEALELKPDFVKALHGLGLVYLNSGRHEQAITRLEQSIALAPNAAPIYIDLGRAYEKIHEYDKALNSYKKAASISPGTEIAEKAQAAIRNLENLW